MDSTACPGVVQRFRFGFRRPASSLKDFAGAVFVHRGALNEDWVIQDLNLKLQPAPYKALIESQQNQEVRVETLVILLDSKDNRLKRLAAKDI